MEIRPPARSSKYYLPKQKFLTVYHYCLQYREWKDALDSMVEVGAVTYDGMPRGSGTGDRTSSAAIKRAEIETKMKMVEDAVRDADSGIYKWLLKGVTENMPYKYLRTIMGIPCGHNRYFEARRRFYWLMAARMDTWITG